MDTEELIKNCKAISLNGETRGKITLKSRMKEKGEKIMAGCLVGKVLLIREVKKEGFKAALLPVWKIMKEIKIEELGDNIFIFQFGCEADKRKVLAGGPWHFDKALIVITKPAGLGEVTKKNFTHVSFWVQILNVPIMCMNTEMLRELGESIKRVEEVATDVTGACFGKYARLRISIDITKPLIKVLHLRHEDEDTMDREEQEEGEDSVNSEKEIPMPVRYERLPDFCYVCGHVGHQYRECANYKNQLREEMAFGPWMKAPLMIEQLKQNRGKEKGKTESEKKSQNYQTTVVQDKQGNPEPQMGQTKNLEKMGLGQDPSTSVEIPRMSDLSRDKQPGTTEGTLAQGRSKREVGNGNLKERENESEIEKKKS
ncbi:CCHC-type domain-containing protein [Citrus sinensis]|nr:CCHC-type domain-containing protein [Citrus sinensis]